jgi:hypothetical protein
MWFRHYGHIIFQFFESKLNCSIYDPRAVDSTMVYYLFLYFTFFLTGLFHCVFLFGFKYIILSWLREPTGQVTREVTSNKRTRYPLLKVMYRDGKQGIHSRRPRRQFRVLLTYLSPRCCDPSVDLGRRVGLFSPRLDLLLHAEHRYVDISRFFPGRLMFRESLPKIDDSWLIH